MTSLKRGFRVESKNAKTKNQTKKQNKTKKEQSLMQSKPADVSPLKQFLFFLFFFLKKSTKCAWTHVQMSQICVEKKRKAKSGIKEEEDEEGW